ncbi:Hypothetical_protein [Hexamita inflata]|uniref:Hypothetical_protein n=1 Tax=Hexamita inflata TaxID=28002 RepID=A0AA86PUN4_9EUKA|nr:Hypothetical protein HINF_LOCUS31490 [Hexamita inflata]CAI9943848.1 Hypothetical protein HINF_LOCUS31493 [Hexamita inflata]CAI9943851.1 Hypothetical protein HINF_LOCUS31496 [Hexamita inflata]CAI9943855.1 Hypothetical protein HINF_LOCUS31500 [Hexamita inflata]
MVMASRSKVVILISTHVTQNCDISSHVPLNTLQMKPSFDGDQYTSIFIIRFCTQQQFVNGGVSAKLALLTSINSLAPSIKVLQIIIISLQNLYENFKLHHFQIHKMEFWSIIMILYAETFAKVIAFVYYTQNQNTRVDKFKEIIVLNSVRLKYIYDTSTLQETKNKFF